jgi:hypothetical protein
MTHHEMEIFERLMLAVERIAESLGKISEILEDHA